MVSSMWWIFILRSGTFKLKPSSLIRVFGYNFTSQKTTGVSPPFPTQVVCPTVNELSPRWKCTKSIRSFPLVNPWLVLGVQQTLIYLLHIGVCKYTSQTHQFFYLKYILRGLKYLRKLKILKNSIMTFVYMRGHFHVFSKLHFPFRSMFSILQY